jgi:hypothetical protein
VPRANNDRIYGLFGVTVSFYCVDICWPPAPTGAWPLSPPVLPILGGVAAAVGWQCMPLSTDQPHIPFLEIHRAEFFNAPSSSTHPAPDPGCPLSLPSPHVSIARLDRDPPTLASTVLASVPPRVQRALLPVVRSIVPEKSGTGGEGPSLIKWQSDPQITTNEAWPGVGFAQALLIAAG